MNRDVIVEFKALSKTYGKGARAVKALRGIDLKVYKGEFLAIMGASGSGKSTCLNIMGFLDTPTSGTYIFKDTVVNNLTKKELALFRRYYIGFVFQRYNLLERSTALENIELPLIYHGISSKKRREKALSALQSVGLAGKEGYLPSQLSGGQQQRVAIARAIVKNPLVLLADEPTGNLDSEMSHEIMKLIFKLNKEKSITVVLVTHEKEMAKYADRIILLKDGMIIKEEK